MYRNLFFFLFFLLLYLYLLFGNVCAFIYLFVIFCFIVLLSKWNSVYVNKWNGSYENSSMVIKKKNRSDRWIWQAFGMTQSTPMTTVKLYNLTFYSNKRKKVKFDYFVCVMKAMKIKIHDDDDNDYNNTISNSGSGWEM